MGAHMIDLSDWVAIVTGGTRGPGRRTAGRLAAAGAKGGVCGRSEPMLAEGVEFLATEVGELEQVSALAERRA